MAPLWVAIVVPILALILGLVGGVLIARKLVSRELEKNPPITEAMIKAMYQSMGRTPSQAQVNQTMRAIKQAQQSASK